MYACDFWGLFKVCLEGKSPCDLFQAKLCRYILGVGKNTSTLGVLYETGRIPWSIEAQIRAFDNYIRILSSTSDAIPSLSSSYALDQNLLFKSNLVKFLEVANMPFLIHIIGSLTPKSKLSTIIKDYLVSKFLLECDFNFLRTSSKMSLLRSIKPTFHRATYIDKLSFQKRQHLAKLRLSNHDLEVERGRYINIPRQKRMCKLCNKAVGTVSHLLLECTHLDVQRDTLFRQVEKVIPHFRTCSETEKLAFLLNQHIGVIPNLVIDMYEMCSIKLQYRECSALISAAFF